MDKFKVCVARHATKTRRTEDRDYDIVKFFNNEDDARDYYCKIRNDNYETNIFGYAKNRWRIISASCHGSLA